MSKSAQIVIAYADSPPGTTPDPEAAALLAKDEQAVAPLIDRPVAVAAHDVTRDQDAAGESALGDLVADSQRSVMETDVAFVTTGTLRYDLPEGNVTWGDLFTIQPFSGSIVSMTLTGQQIRDALERQWEEPVPPHNLAVSGLTYTYDATKPAGSRVTGCHCRRSPARSVGDLYGGHGGLPLHRRRRVYGSGERDPHRKRAVRCRYPCVVPRLAPPAGEREPPTRESGKPDESGKTDQAEGPESRSFRSFTRRFAANVRASRGLTAWAGSPMAAAIFLGEFHGIGGMLRHRLRRTASWIVRRYSSARSICPVCFLHLSSARPTRREGPVSR